MGGALARPADRFPDLFTSSFWETYPYFLPCGVAASVVAATTIILFFFLEEVGRAISGDYRVITHPIIDVGCEAQKQTFLRSKRCYRARSRTIYTQHHATANTPSRPLRAVHHLSRRVLRRPGIPRHFGEIPPSLILLHPDHLRRPQSIPIQYWRMSRLSGPRGRHFPTLVPRQARRLDGS